MPHTVSGDSEIHFAAAYCHSPYSLFGRLPGFPGNRRRRAEAVTYRMAIWLAERRLITPVKVEHWFAALTLAGTISKPPTAF